MNPSYSARTPAPEKEASYTDYNQYHEVKDFLEKCHLQQYLGTFTEEGFESLRAILEITEEDLIALDVKRGHRRVIQRGIATIKGFPKNQPLNMANNTPNYINSNNSTIARSKPNNTGNNSSEGSSTNYSTSGYGSMSGSPRHFSPLGSRPYEPSFNTSIYAVNNNLPIEQQRQQQQRQQEPQPQSLASILNNEDCTSPSATDIDMKDMKEYRSSFSSNDEEDEEDTMTSTSNNPTMNGLNIDDDSSSMSMDTIPLKRKYRRHPKPDKNAPTKPPSAYIMFSNDARARLDKDHNMGFVEIAKLVGDQWKKLNNNQRQSYERTAMRAKDEYLDTLNQYKSTKEYKNYQIYLNNFKKEQDATNRKIARSRKRAKRESPSSGSMADNSSNGNDNTNNIRSNSNGSTETNSTDSFNDRDADNARSSSSSGSTDIYKVHRKKHPNDVNNSSRSSSNGTSDDTNNEDGPSSLDNTNNNNNNANNNENKNNDSHPISQTRTALSPRNESYSPQQSAPPFMSDKEAKSNYHRLPFIDAPLSQPLKE